MTLSDLIARVEAATPDKPQRCKDCDEDCWGLNHVSCWLYDPAQGFCPWLHPGLEFPPLQQQGEQT